MADRRRSGGFPTAGAVWFREDRKLVMTGETILFSPEKTFDCGQAFRWEASPENPGAFRGVTGGQVYSVRGENGRIEAENLSEKPKEGWAEELVRYFDGETDYRALNAELEEKDPVLKEAVRLSEGIRLLRQELFETVISFLISQNNNIPRIRGCIRLLCETYGEKIPCKDGKTEYAFPCAKVLAARNPEELREICRVGYRASYLVKTAERFAEEDAEVKIVRAAAGEELRTRLTELPGVGPKVANCIALFAGLDRSSFPVDVWVERMLHRFYSLKETNREFLEKWGKNYFGSEAGIAQQYLFYAIRAGEKKG